jgi:hypothetical protein
MSGVQIAREIKALEKDARARQNLEFEGGQGPGPVGGAEEGPRREAADFDPGSAWHRAK